METNCKGNIFATPMEVGSITDEEITALTVDAPDIERSILETAAFLLYRAKIKSGDCTPWRALLSAVRASEPVQIEASVVFQDGVQGNQTVVMDRGYGLTGDSQLMFSALNELSEVLGRIENLDAAKYQCKAVTGAVLRDVGKRGGRPGGDVTDQQIVAWLTENKFADSENKKALIIKAFDDLKVKKTRLMQLANNAGMTKKRSNHKPK